jgi:hypothetical protein
MSETEPTVAQPTPIVAQPTSMAAQQPAPVVAQPTPTQPETTPAKPEPTDTQRQLAGHIADARRSLTPDSAAVGQVHATLAVAYAILAASESQTRL